nr:hypothetical protein GCM10025730_21940 [Promicromonospora thailandica]
MLGRREDEADGVQEADTERALRGGAEHPEPGAHRPGDLVARQAVEGPPCVAWHGRGPAGTRVPPSAASTITTAGRAPSRAGPVSGP